MADKENVLTLLQENARLSTTEIAERLNADEADVAATIDRCEKDRTILGYYTLVTDTAFRQAKVRAVIEVDVEPERDTGFDRIAKSISRFSEVRDVLLISGVADLLLMVEGSTLQEVADFGR